MPFRGSKSETGWGPISRHRSSVRHVTPVQCVTGDRTGQTPRPGRSTKYECTSTLGVRERQTRCCSQIKPNVSQVMIPGNISPKCVLLPPGSPFYFLRFSRYEQASTAMASVRGRCCLCNCPDAVVVGRPIHGAASLVIPSTAEQPSTRRRRRQCPRNRAQHSRCWLPSRSTDISAYQGQTRPTQQTMNC
jgi:hypothetical protein